MGLGHSQGPMHLSSTVVLGIKPGTPEPRVFESVVSTMVLFLWLEPLPDVPGQLRLHGDRHDKFCSEGHKTPGGGCFASTSRPFCTDGTSQGPGVKWTFAVQKVFPVLSTGWTDSS